MSKNVFITGSSRGIGKAIATLYAENGYNIIINGNKNIKALKETENELKQINPNILALSGDVSDYNTCVEIFEQISRTFGSVDILINNAGISSIGLFNTQTPDEWKRVIDANLFSVFNCTSLAVKDMINKKSGVVINISSMWGRLGASCEAVYSASKGAINSFTLAMAKELAPCNIRFNAVSPGVIETDMNKCFSDEERKELENEIPLLRFGSPREVAEVVYFLSSDKAGYITGQIIGIDGGLT